MYRMLVGKRKENRSLGRQKDDGNIILKLIVKIGCMELDFI